jgi:hypothetical protein
VTAAQSLRRPAAKLRSSRTGLGLAGPGSEVVSGSLAERAGELAHQVARDGYLLAAGGDLAEDAAVGVGELAGRGEDPAGHRPRRGGRQRNRPGCCLAQIGGAPARAQAAGVAASADLLEYTELSVLRQEAAAHRPAMCWPSSQLTLSQASCASTQVTARQAPSDLLDG